MLQLLALLPETASLSIADVALDALDAFSRVPHVINKKSSVRSKAEQLRWILEHGNTMEMAKRASLGLTPNQVQPLAIMVVTQSLVLPPTTRPPLSC